DKLGRACVSISGPGTFGNYKIRWNARSFFPMAMRFPRGPCNSKRGSLRPRAFRKDWFRKSSTGMERSKKLGRALRSMSNGCWWGRRCTNAGGTKRGRPRNLGFRRRRCSPNCAAWGWKNKARLIPANAGVERQGSQRPYANLNVTIAGLRQERRKLLRAEETRDGIGEIFIGGALAGNPPADARKHTTEIPAVEIPPGARRRLREFEDGNRSAGFENAMNLAQTGFIIRQIAKAEGRGDEIERAAGKGQAQRVGFEKWDEPSILGARKGYRLCLR